MTLKVRFEWDRNYRVICHIEMGCSEDIALWEQIRDKFMEIVAVANGYKPEA